MGWFKKIFRFVKFNKTTVDNFNMLSITVFKDIEPKKFKTLGLVLYNSNNKKEYSLDIVLTGKWAPYGISVGYPK